MVEEILKVVTEYEQCLRRSSCAPRLSYGLLVLAEDGGPNAMFFTCLFCEEATTLQFLQDVGLLRSKEQCNTCGGGMTCSVDQSVSDGYRWRCRKRNGGTRCFDSRCNKHGSWFHHSNLTYLEILLITYGIVCHESAVRIQHEFRLCVHTIADWGIISLSRREHRLDVVRCATLHVILGSSSHKFHVSSTRCSLA
jgi:hypothetical protein